VYFPFYYSSTQVIRLKSNRSFDRIQIIIEGKIMKSQRFFWTFCLLVLFVGYSCRKTPSDPGDGNNNGNNNGNEDIVYGDTATANVKMPQFDIPWPSLADSPWPMSTVNPQGIARCSYSGPSLGVVKWSTDLDAGKATYGPAIGPDGTVYTTMHAFGLYAINGDGTIKWSVLNTKELHPRTGPVVAADSTIYIGGVGFRAFSPDGTEKWVFREDRGFAEVRPLVGIDGTIYPRDAMENIYAITPDGNMIWQQNLGPSYGTVVASPDGSTIYSVQGLILYALDAGTGTVFWSIDTGISDFDYGPAVDNQGNIYYVGGESDNKVYIYSLDPAGQIRWKYYITIALSRNVSSICIDWNGYIYVAWYGIGISALDYEGQFRWRLQKYNYTFDPVICDIENRLYIGNWDAPVFWCHHSDGSLIFTFEIPDFGPVHYFAIGMNGVMYISGRFNSVIALE
jgi:hypothetical protein